MFNIILAAIIGFVIGTLFGVVIMALMAAASRDSRRRDEKE